MQIKHLTVEFAELKFSDLGLGPDADSADFFPRSTPFLDGINLGENEIEFDTAPSQVTAILTGFKVWFQDPSDRELGSLEVRVGQPQKVMGSDTRFAVPITFGLRDWSGDWDDEHGAVIHVAVIGD